VVRNWNDSGRASMENGTTGTSGTGGTKKVASCGLRVEDEGQTTDDRGMGNGRQLKRKAEVEKWMVSNIELCASAYPPAAGRPEGAAMGGAGCAVPCGHFALLVRLGEALRGCPTTQSVFGASRGPKPPPKRRRVLARVAAMGWAWCDGRATVWGK